MPEHLRALVVIIVIAAGVFFVARGPAMHVVAPVDFRRWRNLWFATTIAAFLAHSFWIYAIVAVLVLTFLSRGDRDVVASFFAVLFCVPPASLTIPGFGLIEHFFRLDHIGLIVLVILLPAAVRLHLQSGTLRIGRAPPDKYVAAYAVLMILIHFRNSSLTGTMRETFYMFLFMLLPYYVISRSLRDLQSFRDSMTAFLFAASVMGVIALFEFTRHWLLYRAVIGALGLEWSFLNYIGRAGSLRAAASTGHPIALGYVMLVAIGFFLFLKKNVPSAMYRHLGLTTLAAGLFSSLSRGPWVGLAVLVVVFLGTGRSAMQRLTLAVLGSGLALLLLSLIPWGQRIIDVLPWIGTIDAGSITYREQLITNSWDVIKRNPLFGSVNYLETSEMEAMRQGENIIDVVNSYIGIALKTGLVGLALFVAFFMSVLLGIWQNMRRLEDKEGDEFLLGRSLLATLTGVLVTLATVSSITVIPIVYWSVAALGAAFAEMLRLAQVERQYNHSRRLRASIAQNAD